MGHGSEHRHDVKHVRESDAPISLDQGPTAGRETLRGSSRVCRTRYLAGAQQHDTQWCPSSATQTVVRTRSGRAVSLPRATSHSRLVGLLPHRTRLPCYASPCTTPSPTLASRPPPPSSSYKTASDSDQEHLSLDYPRCHAPRRRTNVELPFPAGCHDSSSGSTLNRTRLLQIKGVRQFHKDMAARHARLPSIRINATLESQLRHTECGAPRLSAASQTNSRSDGDSTVDTCEQRTHARPGPARDVAGLTRPGPLSWLHIAQSRQDCRVVCTGKPKRTGIHGFGG